MAVTLSAPLSARMLQVKFKSRKNADLLNGSLYMHIETLWNASQPLLEQGKYAPTLDAAVEGCLAALPWWSDPQSA